MVRYWTALKPPLLHHQTIKTMNWGTKLVIGMLCFMSFIIVLGILMFNSKDDALVDKDYYEKGLEYDKDYNRKEQVKTDDAAPEITVLSDEMRITFKAAAQGELKLIRNSDQRMDKKTAIKTDGANQVKPSLKGISKGRWKIILSWMTDGKAYLNEQEITVL